MELDDVLRQYVGQFGRYQWMILLFISVEEFFIAFHILSPVFVVGTPKHTCNIPLPSPLNCTRDNLLSFALPLDKHGKYSSCEMYSRNYSTITEDEVCSQEISNISTTNITHHGGAVHTMKCYSWQYDDTVFSNTMVTEWDLVCDSEYLAASVSAITFVAFVTGCAVFGFMSDWQGRKPVMVGAGILYVLAGMGIALAPNFKTVLALRFFQMFFGAGKTSVALVMILEFIGPDKRVVAMVIYFMYWVVAYLLLPGIAYLLQDWRTLQLVISTPEILYCILFIFIIPESPRWLLAKRKQEKAYDILRKMATMNRTKFPDGVSITESRRKTGTVMDLIRTPAIRKVTLNIFFGWCANNFVYYGLSLNTSNIGGSPYWNFLIAGAVELPSNLLLIPMLQYLGRVYSYSAFMLLAGASLLAVIPIPTDLVWLIVAVAMLGKFCVSGSFTLLMHYTTEVYPTEIRAIGITTANIPGRCSAALAAYVGMLSKVHPSLPLVVFGVISITSGLLALALPETRGAPLTQTVAQGEAFIQKNAGALCCCALQKRKCCASGTQTQPSDVTWEEKGAEVTPLSDQHPCVVEDEV